MIFYFHGNSGRAKIFIAVVAGIAQLGEIPATDFIASRSLTAASTILEQDAQIIELAQAMSTMRADYWQQTQVPEDQWPGTSIMLATTSATTMRPRVWHITFQTAQPKIDEILQEPRIWLEGSYLNAFTLLYGFDPEMHEALQQELGISDPISRLLGKK